jgi:hypothetical protein
LRQSLHNDASRHKTATPEPAPTAISGDAHAHGAADPLAAAASEDNMRKIVAAAAAAMAARKDDQRDDKAWTKHSGTKLEAALTRDATHGDSPVRALDARFLIGLHERGGVLCRRQALPEGAFLTLEEVKRLPPGGRAANCLRFAAVSHPWQHPDMPDPLSFNLAILARFLKCLLAEEGGYEKRNATYAVFFE